MSCVIPPNGEFAGRLDFFEKKKKNWGAVRDLDLWLSESSCGMAKI